MTTRDMKRLMAMWKRSHRKNVAFWKGKVPFKPRYPRGYLILAIGGLWVFWSGKFALAYFPRLQTIKHAGCESDGHAMHIPGLVFIW